MLEVTQERSDDGTVLTDESHDDSPLAAAVHLRYAAGFLVSLLVYGLLPPVLTGAAILYAHGSLGITAHIPLAAVGLAAGTGFYLTAFVADRGVQGLTGGRSDGSRGEPSPPPERHG